MRSRPGSRRGASQQPCPSTDRRHSALQPHPNGSPAGWRSYQQGAAAVGLIGLAPHQSCRHGRGDQLAGARLADGQGRRLRVQIRLGCVSIDPAIRFPGESGDYRLARNRLLEAETELRRAIERVAAQRRALPPGGAVPEDYVFEEAADGGGEVRFSQLFAPGKDTLVIYSFMFPRWSGDTRPGPAGGETARLPLAETPCPSCTSILDSLDGAARHLAHPLSLVVVAKSDPARIRNFARERGWRHLRLLSSRNNSYNRDYHAETPDGEQSPVLNVFTRDGDGFRHRWATELMFAPRDEGEEPRHVDSIWPIWNVLDMTPGGRGDDPNFPALHYQ